MNGNKWNTLKWKAVIERAVIYTIYIYLHIVKLQQILICYMWIVTFFVLYLSLQIDHQTS